MTPADVGPAWVRVCDADTTRAELELIIAAYTRVALVDVFEQIEQIAAFSSAEQLAALRLAAPVVRAQVRQTIERGWRRLQDERLQAEQTDDGAVH